ncbi:addiction module protein [Litoribrevibacter euphylliae]|uniref:Addiction module protein n=1 Tax=Litoribrevibacter euphylliae TaxID=1834034 RepID=A0ABV7HEJ4_9GAMM
MNIQNLTISERIILAEALWDSIANQESEVVLTEKQKLELDARLSNYEIDQDAGSSWAAVKERITSKK